MLINALHGHLAELGIISSKGPRGVGPAIAALNEAADEMPEANSSAANDDQISARVSGWSALGRKGCVQEAYQEEHVLYSELKQLEWWASDDAYTRD